MLVVILNFNSLDYTLACLASLARQSFRDFDVLVIDNASRADDLGRIAAAHPAAEVLALTQNLGWAGGNNVGLRLALERGHTAACLLNADTVLDPTALAELAAAADEIGAPCLLHPAIRYFDTPERYQLWVEPGPEAAAQELARRTGIVRMDWAYGACLLLPIAVVRAVGLFDERFFLQLEEEDYFRRAAALGMASYCARRAGILHKESASFGSRVTPDKIYYQIRNALLLAEKHEPSWGARGRTLRRLLWALSGQLQEGAAPSWAGLLRRLVSADPRARAARQGLRDYLARRFGRRGG